MRWQRLTCCAGLLLAWVALAAWQEHEYGHERELAREILRRQADSITNALVGGIRSHRRLGRFFPEQLQGALDELVTSPDVLAVAVTSRDGSLLLAAGKVQLLRATSAVVPGQSWDGGGFRWVSEFELSADPGAGLPGGPDEVRGDGRGRGWGGGWGGGWGRGPRWQEEAESRLATGGRFFAMLLLDDSRVEAQCRRAAWLRASVVVAGGVVLVCVALAWRAMVRMVEARGRARVLETEARHLRELSQAAAGLAHETRNPLGLIRGWAQRLADSELPSPEQLQQALAVVEECDRVTSRINHFIAFARPWEPRLEPVSVAAVVDELSTLLEPDLDSKNLKLARLDVDPQRTIQADREMFRQAVFNLLGNAVQFAPEGGTIEITLRGGQDGCLRVEVADRGPGVPAAAAASLFTPYFTTRADGTGLGLAIVHRIAAAHGWEVGYTPRLGGGSIFWLDRIHG